MTTFEPVKIPSTVSHEEPKTIPVSTKLITTTVCPACKETETSPIMIIETVFTTAACTKGCEHNSEATSVPKITSSPEPSQASHGALHASSSTSTHQREGATSSPQATAPQIKDFETVRLGGLDSAESQDNAKSEVVENEQLSSPSQNGPPRPSGRITIPSSPPQSKPDNVLVFAPQITDNFNFYDGGSFNAGGTSMFSKADRTKQARTINSALPPSVQLEFNEEKINFYEPGTGDFYYTKVDSDKGSSIVQVAKSCDCYVSSADDKVHYLSFDQDSKLNSSVFNAETDLPPATVAVIQKGNTLTAVADRFGIPVSLIFAANPKITNPDKIKTGQEIEIPAQSYTVVADDTLLKIAKRYGMYLNSLRALNPQIKNTNAIEIGQIINVGVDNLQRPFTYTVTNGDTLWEISKKLGVTLQALEDANPQIENFDLIYPKQVINTPSYLPAQGKVTYKDTYPLQEDVHSPLVGAKFKRANSTPMRTTTIEVGFANPPIIARFTDSAKLSTGTKPDESVETSSWFKLGEYPSIKFE
jgi:LysM repeat protein